MGVYRWGSKRGHNFSLWLHPLFQGELYSITADVRENTVDYTGRSICIPSDSHATIKDLESFRINSKLVWKAIITCWNWQHIIVSTCYACRETWRLMEVKQLIK